MVTALLTSKVALVACRYHLRRHVNEGALRVVCLALSMLLVGTPEWARAEEATANGTATDRGVKAAFLYKFTGYVEWPASTFAQSDSPIVIGVTGADEIAAELQQVIAGRTVNNRPLALRRVREGESLDGLHVLFVGRGQAARIPALARAAQQRSILLVTESPGALDSGSVINFVMSDGHVRFEISLDAAERSALKLSSRLLAVAQVVRGTS